MTYLYFAKKALGAVCFITDKYICTGDEVAVQYADHKIAVGFIISQRIVFDNACAGDVAKIAQKNYVKAIGTIDRFEEEEK